MSREKQPVPISRRKALKAVALPCLAALPTAACVTTGRTVRVAVVWTGWELAQFEKVMHAFRDTYGWDFSILSMGDDIGAFLSNEVAAAARPDVALVPQPGLVTGNIPRLSAVAWPLDDAATWKGLLESPGRHRGWQYGVWFKAAYKSMVWHRGDLPPSVPSMDWDHWHNYCYKQARAGHPPLAIGAADGWVLAMWFANALLSVSPQSYAKLTSEYKTGRKVGTGPTWRNRSTHEALCRLGRLWQIRGAFPGGPERALDTQFDQSVLDVFEYRHAAMVVGADFFWPIITQFTSFPPEHVRWFHFPCKTDENPPAIVGGDAAVLFKRADGNPGGHKLIEWLTMPGAAQIWAGSGGFLSINNLVTEQDYRYPPGMNTKQLIRNVRRASLPKCAAAFDLADQLGGRLAGGDGAGTWEILTEFFTQVAVRRSDVDTAVDTAIDALNGGSAA